MKIDSVVIREILVKLAPLKGRPYFDTIVVRAVLDAFRYDTHHFLKPEILSYYNEHYSKEVILTNTVQMDTALMAERQLLLRKACVNREAMRVISRNSGVDFSVISSLSKGRCQLTQLIWDKVEPEINQLLSIKD